VRVGKVRVGVKVVVVPSVGVGTCNVPVGVGVVRVVRVSGVCVRRVGMGGVIVVRVSHVSVGHVGVVRVIGVVRVVFVENRHRAILTYYQVFA
jgi:hypothetical protein